MAMVSPNPKHGKGTLDSKEFASRCASPPLVTFIVYCNTSASKLAIHVKRVDAVLQLTKLREKSQNSNFDFCKSSEHVVFAPNSCLQYNANEPACCFRKHYEYSLSLLYCGSRIGIT